MSKFEYLNGGTITAEARCMVLVGPMDTRLNWVRIIVTNLGEFRVHAHGLEGRRSYLVCPAEMSHLVRGDTIILRGKIGAHECAHWGEITSDPNERNECGVMLGRAL